MQYLISFLPFTAKVSDSEIADVSNLVSPKLTKVKVEDHELTAG
jgi:hypothetical protein